MTAPTSARSRRLGFWLVTAAAVCWSSGGLIARLVATDPWTTVFWRSVFCAGFLSCTVAIGQRGRVGRLVRDTGWPLHRRPHGHPGTRPNPLAETEPASEASGFGRVPGWPWGRRWLARS